MPWLTRIGPLEWIEDRTGERLQSDVLIERYGHLLPPEFFDSPLQSVPESFTKLIASTDCHLIETQRLLALPTDDLRFSASYEHRRARSQTQWAVYQKAQKLKDIFQQQLTRYATLSQSLDRTFPKRAIERGQTSAASSDKITSQLRSLDSRREALMNAGILDKSYEPITLDYQYIEAAVLGVLEIYVEDTNYKLEVFDRLLQKTELFQKLMRDRLAPKIVTINREDGFQVSSTRGKAIPLEKLSSGEQHQLILLFDLIFEVGKNSLILIDEPELSLHISWQKKFISDLKNIISLNNFDVVLATHSAALISRSYDLAIELGDVENG